MKLFKAFTLVELLVVMAIISFLSVGAFAGLSFGLRQARDVQKKKIVDLAHTALQAYYSDFGSYPKCQSGNGTPSTNLTNWSYCTQAFPYYTAGSAASGGYLITNNGAAIPAGLKDYIEGEWPTQNGNANPGATDEYLRYYVNRGTGNKLKFAVCITLENKTASSNIIRKVSGVSNGPKDCYCAGTEYAEVACNDMSSRL